MHACHDEVEAGKDVIGIVERTVSQDVGFNAFEDAEFVTVSLVEAVDLGMLLFNLFDGKPARVVR